MHFSCGKLALTSLVYAKPDWKVSFNYHQLAKNSRSLFVSNLSLNKCSDFSNDFVFDLTSNWNQARFQSQREKELYTFLGLLLLDLKLFTELRKRVILPFRNRGYQQLILFQLRQVKNNLPLWIRLSWVSMCLGAHLWFH